MAQAMASGFENLKPGPQAKVSQAHGLALAWPILLGLAWLLASGPSQHITRYSTEEAIKALRKSKCKAL
jgi:hypothetical protein